VTPTSGAAVRQRVIREIVSRQPIGSQAALVEELAARGVVVTQATVSRDVAELGLVKVARGGRHVYVLPEDIAPHPTSDTKLRRLLAESPVTVGRSGLILLLVGPPGSASLIAQAIDESGVGDQEGTLAGDNTVLVLFADETRLERWNRWFRTMQGLPTPGAGSAASSTGATGSNQESNP